MSKILKDLVQFLRLGELLSHDLSNEIREAEESSWDATLVGNIRDTVEKYIKSACRFSLYLSLLAGVPLLFIIKFLIEEKPHPIFYGIYVAWASALGITAAWLFFPLITIAPPLRKLPDAVYRDLLGPLWLSIELLYILVSGELIGYLYPALDLSKSAPLFALLIVLWIFGPWMLFLTKRDKTFIQVRVTQLGLLILGAFAIAASPIPISHFQWRAQRSLADALRPTERKDITESWASLQWFTPEGAPNVWFALRPNGHYVLFAAPGFDPDTNTALSPVDSAATKERIVAQFRAEDLSRKQENELTLERQAEAKLAAQRLRASEEKLRLVREFVVHGKETSKAKNALIVLMNNNVDARTADWLSAALSKAGVTTDTAVFSPAFVASTQFRALHSNNSGLISEFNPADYCDNLLIADGSVAYGKESQPVEMITADLHMRIRLVAAADGLLRRETEVTSRGVGFNEADALKLALERVETQISSNARNVFKQD